MKTSHECQWQVLRVAVGLKAGRRHEDAAEHEQGERTPFRG